MRKVRYFLGIICAVAAFVFGMMINFATGAEKIAFSYLLAAVVAELIWGRSFAWKISLFFLKIVLKIFFFWGGILLSGVLLFIVALLLAAPVFSFLASLLGVAVIVLVALSALLFPVHVFTRLR